MRLFIVLLWWDETFICCCSAVWLSLSASKLLTMCLLCLCSVLSKEQGITVIVVCLSVEVFVLLNVRSFFFFLTLVLTL